MDDLRRFPGALALDIPLTGGYAAAVYFGYSWLSTMFIVLFWWMGLAAMLVVFVRWAVKYAYNGPVPPPDKVVAAHNAVYSDKVVAEACYGPLYFAYHTATDLILWALLIHTGHFALTALYVLFFIHTLSHTVYCRRLMDERALSA